MKMNKMMFAALAFAAVAMVGCGKKNNDPITPTPTPTPGDDPQEEVEIPEVDAPGAGKVTIVLQIPEGSECNGIALKGTLDGANWSGANQYVSATTGQAAVADAIKFEAIDGSKVWFKATYNLGTEAWGDNSDVNLAGKVCLIYTDDGNWQGQAEDNELIADYTTVDCSYDGDLLIHGTTGGLCYIKVGNWQNSECVTKVYKDYNVTVKVPTCADVTPEVIGDFDEWSGTALTKDGDVWKATIRAAEGDKIKVREAGKGNWDNQIQEHDAENDSWSDCGDMKLGADAKFDIDFSDAEKYRWTICAE